jgi:hypothetical protein
MACAGPRRPPRANWRMPWDLASRVSRSSGSGAGDRSKPGFNTNPEVSDSGRRARASSCRRRRESRAGPQ